MDFDHRLHQKVTYLGQDQFLKTIHLFVVIKEEFPNFYSMKTDEEVVIHQLNKFNQVIRNLDLQIRNSFKAKKGELNLEGELYGHKQ